MGIFSRLYLLLVLLTTGAASLCALESADRTEIEQVIYSYTEAWNEHDCKGFADDFTDDADFVNIYGMHFMGKPEIESRHVKIMQSFLKGSKFKVLNIQTREAHPGFVIAVVYWRVEGFRNPGMDLNTAGVTREGIFSHTFIKSDNKWKITACQNTLIP